jgi:hypothetical protein
MTQTILNEAQNRASSFFNSLKSMLIAATLAFVLPTMIGVMFQDGIQKVESQPQTSHFQALKNVPLNPPSDQTKELSEDKNNETDQTVKSQDNRELTAVEQPLTDAKPDKTGGKQPPSTAINRIIDSGTVKTEAKESTKTADRSFYHGKKWVKGSYLIEIVKNDKNGKMFYDAFNEKYGTETADKMAIVLMFKNGSLSPDTVGVCSPKYRIGGDYRNCNYADLNSAGMDVGVKQVNSFYQASRIKKFSKIDCMPQNSRDRADECTKAIVDWLRVPENNLKIAMDLYDEQGFRPWVGAKKAKLI